MIEATYDPADDKIRLRSDTRLDEETYAKVKAAGFAWAPQQDFFFAMWSPTREDLAEALAGEIGEECTTRAERAQARAERFKTYQDHRTEDAEQARAALSRMVDVVGDKRYSLSHATTEHTRGLLAARQTRDAARVLALDGGAGRTRLRPSSLSGAGMGMLGRKTSRSSKARWPLA